MTKEEVVEQIERSWKPPQNDAFAGMRAPGIERALKPATDGDTCVLSYGRHTGREGQRLSNRPFVRDRKH